MRICILLLKNLKQFVTNFYNYKKKKNINIYLIQFGIKYIIEYNTSYSKIIKIFIRNQSRKKLDIFPHSKYLWLRYRNYLKNMLLKISTMLLITKSFIFPQNYKEIILEDNNINYYINNKKFLYYQTFYYNFILNFISNFNNIYLKGISFTNKYSYNNYSIILVNNIIFKIFRNSRKIFNEIFIFSLTKKFSKAINEYRF
uniref:Uncharacterized protein n=1 Tax=Lotharella vacuolata TaxID=74820 RepID=A0A0H5BK28_9EUKA|nr:hypothetical protein [Lotharella vacuolata]